MREIEFRAKDIDTGEWRYGYYVKRKECTLGAFGVSQDEIDKNIKHYLMYDGWADWNMTNPWYRAEVDGETVGQWTGQFDKNKKRVYEDDILKEDGGLAVVKYEYTEFVAMDTTDKHMCNLMPTGLDSESEVIGNIHDNPELLG